MLLAVAACTHQPVATDGRKPVVAYRIGNGDSGMATYSVVASSHAHGVVTYELASSRAHPAALELLVADGGGRGYFDAGPGKRELAIARDGVVLRAIGAAGAQQERAFLKAMRSPAPKRPLRASATFTSILLGGNESGESTNGVPARLYKLFGMFPDGDDVELYLAVALDGRSVTFSEKDPDYRPSLTTFLSS
ncbi:MAG TPA: hypothetical protein VGU66_14745 [Candidatus Elarobacter sp.]|nr:hypothetical protein [Candidatus Elarobacter sp.]